MNNSRPSEASASDRASAVSPVNDEETLPPLPLPDAQIQSRSLVTRPTADLSLPRTAEEQAEEAEENEQHVLAFFSLGGVGAALRRNGWSIDTEVGMLTGIARGSDEELAFKAMDRLRRIAEKAAVNEGRLQTTTTQRVVEVKRADGSTARMIETERIRLLTQGAARAAKSCMDETALPEAAPEHRQQIAGEGVIDAEYAEIKSDCGGRADCRAEPLADADCTRGGDGPVRDAVPAADPGAGSGVGSPTDNRIGADGLPEVRTQPDA